MHNRRIYQRIGILTKNVLKTPHVDIVLKHVGQDYIFRKEMDGCDAFAGWGYKTTSRIPRKLSQKKNVPYIALEDGFFRSVGSPTRKPPQLSFVADDHGIYYAANRPCALDRYIADGIDDRQRSRASSLIDFIRENRLTKYNYGLDSLSADFARSDGAVLVVDQVRNDASIAYGGADESDFSRMLKYAYDHFPNKTILIKSHIDKPRFLQRKMKGEGYFSQADLPEDMRRSGRVIFLDQHYSSWALFDQVSDVFVITSALGFEALLAGKTVHCFAHPFYAGYGLTQDYQSSVRDKPGIDLDTLVYHSCISYPIYVDPYKQCVCEVEKTLDILTFLKRRICPSFQQKIVAYGISKWKRPVFESFLPEVDKPVLYVNNAKKAVKKSRDLACPLFVWAGRVTPDIQQACSKDDIRLISVEDGFIRSKGLGKNFVLTGSLAFDEAGIYYDAGRPSDIENMLRNVNVDDAQIKRAQILQRQIIEARVTKYNSEKQNMSELDISELSISTVCAEGSVSVKPRHKSVHLVVGQNDSDASIRRGAKDIVTSRGLLAKVRADYPNDYIIYKPHPDLAFEDLEERDADYVVRNVSIVSVFEHVDYVHVITSLAGFEALIRGKTVYVYGMPFYAGWGLTHDLYDNDRRDRGLRVDDLVYQALIQYPRYLDPVSKMLCTPELAVERLVEGKGFTKPVQ